MINTDMKYCTNSHYSREAYMELEQLSNTDFFEEKELSYQELKDGIILPMRQSKDTSLGRGGVIDSEGDFVQDSTFHFVWDKDIIGFGGEYQYQDDQVITSDEHVLYLGPLKNEWGHFLIDFMQRLWYAAQYPGDYKIAYIEVKSFNYGKPLLKNIVEMFALLGISEDRLISIKQPTKFQKIIVPQMYMGPWGYRQGYQVLYDKLKQAAEERCKSLPIYEKIYYTRCQLKEHKEIGEEQIEEFFAMNDYKVIAPEKLSASEQIYYMAHCKYFACIEGSAAHNIVFAEPDLQQYIIGKRCRNNLRQPIINQMMGIDVTYISAFATLGRDDGFLGPFLMDVNADLRCFANDYQMQLNVNYIRPIKYYLKYYYSSYYQLFMNKWNSFCRKLNRK